MSSLASVISTPMSRVGHALHRSISGAKLQHTKLTPDLQRITPTLRSATPSKFFNRSFSHAQISDESSVAMRAPESPYGTLRRGSQARSSATHLTPYKYDL